MVDQVPSPPEDPRRVRPGDSRQRDHLANERTLLAWVLVRYRFPGRRVLSSVVDLPLAIPTLVWGVMILVLYGPNSVLGKAAETLREALALWRGPALADFSFAGAFGASFWKCWR